MKSFKGCSRIEITSADNPIHGPGLGLNVDQNLARISVIQSLIGHVAIVMKPTRDNLAWVEIDGKRNPCDQNKMTLFPPGDLRRIRVLIHPEDCTRINYFAGELVKCQ